MLPVQFNNLRQLGHDVERVSDLAPPTLPDAGIVSLAVHECRVNSILQHALPNLESVVPDGAIITIEDHRIRVRRLPLQ